jgi:hypothetical protein
MVARATAVQKGLCF